MGIPSFPGKGFRPCTSVPRLSLDSALVVQPHYDIVGELPLIAQFERTCIDESNLKNQFANNIIMGLYEINSSGT